jgi:hypothetical protein
MANASCRYVAKVFSTKIDKTSLKNIFFNKKMILHNLYANRCNKINSIIFINKVTFNHVYNNIMSSKKRKQPMYHGLFLIDL